MGILFQEFEVRTVGEGDWDVAGGLLVVVVSWRYKGRLFSSYRID